MGTKLVDAGIDYVRITTEQQPNAKMMFEFFRKVLVRDQKLGYEPKSGGAFGFMGTKTRHALYGEKKGWYMLQVSGYEAKQALRLAVDGTQATRIDLQLTVWVGEDVVEKTIRDAYNSACLHVRAKSRPVKVNLIESRHTAQTVYIGSRASDVFLRIYDKFEESGKEEYRGCVRFELELKGRMSKAMWQELVGGRATLRSTLEMVLAVFSDRGVEVPCQELDNQDIVHLQRPKTLIENTVTWLVRQVAPTVTKLSASHGWIFAFSALFGDACTEDDRKRIMRSLAVVWGS